MQLEVCIENLQEAELAKQYKCNRIEVCSALDLEGLTPSYSLMNACSKLIGIESHILTLFVKRIHQYLIFQWDQILKQIKINSIKLFKK